MCFYMRTLLTLLLITLISFTSKGQINFFGSFSPRTDSTDIELTNLVKQKKIDDALINLTKSIKADPVNGINYFNRAVINYYKKTIAKNFSIGIDTLIYNDCKRALDNGYDT